MTQRIEVDAADHRRALVALSHQLDNTTDGLAAVLIEANSENRRVELILAMLHTFQQLLPELRTELGIQLVRQQIAFAYAAEENGAQS